MLNILTGKICFIMNNLLRKTYFLFLILLLVASFAKKQIYDGSAVGIESVFKYDTTIVKFAVGIEKFDLDLLPPSSGVQFYRDGIVFLSSLKNEGKMLSTHISFGILQAYYAPLQDTILGQHFAFSSAFAFSFPCEAISFCNNFNTMYFTKISARDGFEKIYKSEYVSRAHNQNGWSLETKPLSFCLEGSSYSHPSVSMDGTIMVFASNNSGSLGGMDLFLTEIEGGNWTVPKNIGNEINTEGNEMFPCLDDKNNLYFSSNGLSGYGSYDIFVSKFDGKGWEKPLNLSKQINSSQDELAFTLNRTDGNSAFFTKRNKSRTEKMQLYRVSLKNRMQIPDSGNLSDVLYSMALSEINSIEAGKVTGKFKTEMIKTDSFEVERIKAERIEAERIIAERIEAERIKAEKIEAERIKTEKIEAEGIKAEKAKADSIEKERIKLINAKDDSIKTAMKKTSISEKKEVVIFKVQCLSSMRPKGSFEISINGKNYTASEYFYLGAYRYTIGAFDDLKQAVELQNECRKSGYNQAFVAAFVNNVRSDNPELFRH